MRSLRYLSGILVFALWAGTLSSIAQETESPPAKASPPAEKAAADEDQSDENQPDEDGADKQKSDETADDTEAASGDESGDDSKSEEAKSAKAEPIKIRCHFVGEEERAVVVRPLEWTSFPIADLVAHGQRVNRGDRLIQFDARKLDVAIEDLKNEIELAQLTLHQEESSFELTRRSQQMALAAAERAERVASEDLKRFLTQGRDDRIESLERSVKSAENRLRYASEEYNQLKRMYEADDLTEDTEEIILKRTKDSMESSQYSLDRIRKAHDRGVDVDIPRTQEGLEESLRQASLGLERAMISVPAKIEQAELALAKKKLDLRRKQQRLQRLEEDREWVEIKAPMSGWVYYGRQKQGKWADSSQMEAILRQGINAKTNQTLLTVVKAGQLQLAGVISEKDLDQIHVGSEGTAKPTAAPKSELGVTVAKISDVPISDGKFEITLNLNALPEDLDLVPGMSCEVTFAPADDKS